MKISIIIVISLIMFIILVSETVSANALNADDRVDNRIILELEHAMPKVVSSPKGAPSTLVSRASAEMLVVITLSRAASPADLQALQNTGSKLGSVNGQVIVFKNFVSAQIDKKSLNALLKLPFVSHISAMPMNAPSPMDNSAELIGLDGAWGSNPPLDLLTGEGVDVLDVDTHADVFHPAFFNADGEYYNWIDMDADSIFTPGTDVIDMNGDGDALNEAIGELLPAVTCFSSYGMFLDDAHIDGFDTGVDWIYIDTNQNGERDYGATNGFDDLTPAFGEPLFVPDDVNQNGRLDLGERLVQLKTSKFVKIFVPKEISDFSTDYVYERGVNLSEYESYNDRHHATGVLSILSGDVPLVGRRNVGVAPNANLKLAVAGLRDATALLWAFQEAPDVILWELAGWLGFPLDGTDIVSTIIDDSMDTLDVTHACPVGNCGGARKHVHIELNTNETISLNLNFTDQAANYHFTNIAVNSSGTGSIAINLTSPEGDSIIVSDAASNAVFPNGVEYWIYYKKTSKNTRFNHVTMYTELSAAPIPNGTWKLEITEQGKGQVTIDGYVGDEISGWGLGFAWDENIATDDRTIGIPAVSNNCIGIGAHTGHAPSSTAEWFYQPGGVNEIRTYSGRGPTIDGRLKPEITAPDNPWAATPKQRSAYNNALIPHGAMSPFGGTSGAGPHVAGVAALLAQTGIHGQEAQKLMQDGAFVDSITGDVPNYDYGWGRLNAAGALNAEADGIAPTVDVIIAENNVIGQPVIIQVNVDDEDSSKDLLEIKWDDNYDGSWDIDYAKVTDREITFNEPGSYVFKVRARDETGRFAEAVAIIEVLSEIPDTNHEEDGGDGGDSDKDSGCGCTITGKSNLSLFAILSQVIFS